MLKLPILNPGDVVEIIAPASRCSDASLLQLQELLTAWQLECHVDTQIFGEDLLCANSDVMRLQLLKNALQNPKSKAIVCARGGYGSMRLIPELLNMPRPAAPKLFIGMSDITALNLFFQQQWQWPTLHGALAPDRFSSESIAATKALMMGETTQVEFSAVALNRAAETNKTLEATLTGGNLSLLQTSIGTIWEIDARNKIIFIEEVSERGYRIDRMLEHLRQAGVFKEATAIVFGDFTGGAEPDGKSFVQPVLQRFAQTCEIPVVQIAGVGHNPLSYPLPLGTVTKLTLGKNIKLVSSFNA